MIGQRKKRRTRMIAAGGLALFSAAALAGIAFNDAIVFFMPPTELLAKAETGEVGPDRRLRLGGLVEDGTVEFGDGGVVYFGVTDQETSVPVRFAGVLPDLFREGQGVVAEGYFREGAFAADEILAKHDEQYMPAEVAEALKRDGQWKPDAE